MTKRRTSHSLTVPGAAWLISCLVITTFSVWHIVNWSRAADEPLSLVPQQVLTLRSQPDVVRLGATPATVQLYLDRGGLLLQQIQVQLILPAGVKLVSASSGDTTCASSIVSSTVAPVTISCSLGEERPGASQATLRLSLTGSQTGQGLLQLVAGTANNAGRSYPLTLTPTTLISN
jgi:hypothetical protein